MKRQMTTVTIGSITKFTLLVNLMVLRPPTVVTAFAPFASPAATSPSSQKSSLINRFSSINDDNSNVPKESKEDGDDFIAVSSSVAQFGDVARLDRDKSAQASQFGDVVRLKPPEKNSDVDSSSPLLKMNENLSPKPSESLTENLQNRRKNNTIVAILAIAMAFANYFWQFTHPLSAIQLLAQMQDSSAPITTLGRNGKPTVVDFWAPWCENCKQMAPTLYQVEKDFSDKVNFVMINADDPNAWPLIEVFGVDAIPHMALVESEGTVDTALIGSVPKGWLESDLQVLLDNSKLDIAQADLASSSNMKASLPYQMLDSFANRPEGRRIKIIQKQ